MSNQIWMPEAMTVDLQIIHTIALDNGWHRTKAYGNVFWNHRYRYLCRIFYYIIFYYYIILYMTGTEISIESEAFNGNKRNTNEHWTFYGAKQDDKTLEIELFLQKRTEYGSKWGICTLPPPGSVWDLLWPLIKTPVSVHGLPKGY